MKKLISLFLALVLSLGLLSGMTLAANEKPAEIHPDLATIKVTCSGDASVECYFEELNQAVVDWACQNLPGKKIVTLLEDTEIFTLTESNIITMPVSSADWYNADIVAAKTDNLVVDLDGHTMTFYGGGNLFEIQRFGMTVKNGTLLYHNNQGKNRCPFVFGTSSGSTANSKADKCYDPTLNLENVHVYSSTGPIANSFYYDTTINVTDSVLWGSGDGNAINLRKTSQSKANNKWKGEFHPAVNVKNSIVGGDKYYFVTCAEETAKVSVENSIVVSNSTNNPIATTAKIDATFVGEKSLNEKWTMGLRDGRTVSGKAFTFGTAPKVMPFTDVKPGDWFYAFVEELYGKSVVAGQTATTFNPAGQLTYAAALKLLVVGLTGKDAGNAASGHWAANYLKEAVAAGWTNIDAAKLNEPITREAFCEIAAKAKNLTKQPAENKFTDTTNTAVLALVEAGVINGMSETTFSPAGILTRAQISKIISLLLKL